jgi:mannose-6-phosphate isomerase
MIRRIAARPVEKPEWGSTQLEPWFRNSDRKIGEMWFEGPGDAPLLIKFLFTTAALSVQVHPNDEYAREHHNSRGKTEMWHVLRAEPGAQIAAGLREPVTEAQLRAAAISGEIEQLLEWHDANPGDTFFIPAGTVHAIGAGLVLCEIQQAADVTYRLYDYGRPRDLHLEHGARVSRTVPHDARRPSGDGLLVECPYFTTEKYTVSGERVIPSPGRDQNIIILEGKGRIGDEAAQAGDVFHVSADEPAVTLQGPMAVLRTFA